MKVLVTVFSLLIACIGQSQINSQFVAMRPVYTDSISFLYTGNIQTWVVPPNITSIYFEVVGAQGGDLGLINPERIGGKGGRVRGYITVTPGNTLYLTVGGKPISTARNIPVYGFAGSGGNTQFAGRMAAAGGGLSALATANPLTTSNLIVVAGGGGGGSGGQNLNVGGNAGGLSGSTGGTANWVLAGGGGSQIAGGQAGTGGDPNSTNPTAGSSLSGGNGGIALSSASSGWVGGGGGGAGYFGGGGGRAGGNSVGAGGGGSSYASPLVNNVVNTSGYNIGNGYIKIYY